MNVFFLAENPHEAARYHNDKHVVKMIVETAQLLSTAHRVMDSFQIEQNKKKVWVPLPGAQDNVYKLTHINHPCSVWVRQSKDNYKWTYTLYRALLAEFFYRYGKDHKSGELDVLLRKIPDGAYQPFTAEGLTFPALAMPEKYRTINPVDSYRQYYMREKRHIAKWTKREVPKWWN